jgi:hypothetical protein
MIKLKHGQHVFVTLRGVKRYGTVGVGILYHPPVSREDVIRFQRNYLRRDAQVWINQDCTVICDNPAFYARREEERAGAVEVCDGDEVLVEHAHRHPDGGDGAPYPMRAKVLGDYSTLVDFSYVGAKPYLLELADEAREAGTLKPSGPPCYY